MLQSRVNVEAHDYEDEEEMVADEGKEEMGAEEGEEDMIADESEAKCAWAVLRFVISRISRILRKWKNWILQYQ